MQGEQAAGRQSEVPTSSGWLPRLEDHGQKVFWHLVDKYMLAVWGRRLREPVVWPEALQRLALVLSESFESKEVGTIGPNKCGFQWHTDVKHARAVIELMGLDVETSKPAPTPGSKSSRGNKTTKEASCATLKTSLMMRTEMPTAAQQTHFSITHWTDPTSSFLRVVACKGVRALKQKSGTASNTSPGTNKDRGLHRRGVGIKRG